MAKVLIDGREHDVPPEYTLMQACESAGVEVPRFCYHERLSIAGNCRMCLVEVKGMPKPQASCALNVRDLRPGPDGAPPQIITDSPVVKKARDGVLEMLLINHPLDCPICDQGGECDLQDQALGYGADRTRFTFAKRAAEEKDFGPLIKTVMTRCIQCTRCVRFAAEVAGVPEIGAIGRGEHTEITPYIESIVTSELSGNVIDLCPVGALTSKPYAFVARPWEVEKTEAIDVTDALGSNIRIDSRSNGVLRILPRRNDAVNEEWISDKARFCVDGLRRRRLDAPYLRGPDGALRQVAWDAALAAVVEAIRRTPAERVGVVSGDHVDLETAYAFRRLSDDLCIRKRDGRQRGESFDVTQRGAYLFGPGLAAVDAAEKIVLIGCNPRAEAAVFNARLRAAYARGAQMFRVGPPADLTYPVTELGEGPEALTRVPPGSLVILGAAAQCRPDARAVAALFPGAAVLQSSAGTVNALEAGLHTGDALYGGAQIAADPEVDLLLLLHADEVPVTRRPGLCVIYVGSHGDRNAAAADIILPGTTFAERSGWYVNTEGRLQQSLQAVAPPGQARDERMLARALHGMLLDDPGYDTLAQLRAKLLRDLPHLQSYAPPAPALALSGPLQPQPFVAASGSYYLTDPVCRASQTLAECARVKEVPATERVAS